MKAGSAFHGTELELRRMPGARVLRVVHPGAQRIDEHRHDWAYIGLFAMGSYREKYEDGEVGLDGPSAAFHPPGRAHADVIGETGLETLTLEFDPAWLRSHGFTRPLDRSCVWTGGSAGLAARALAATLSSGTSDHQAIGRACAQFLYGALAAERPWSPPWLEQVQERLTEPNCDTRAIARDFDLHPAYLTRAYRAAVGEGIAETIRRRRIEQAVVLLRRTSLSLAEIAQSTGFCDQAHMNRCFRAVLGRSPLVVRREI